MVVYMAKEIAH